MKRNTALPFLLLTGFLPALQRLFHQGVSEPIGLLSDCSFGLAIVLIALYSPRWIRVVVLVLWVLAQAIAHELILAMQRLPVWEDLHYLTDPGFMLKSTSGINLSSPSMLLLFLVVALPACCLPLTRPAWKWFRRGTMLCLLFLFIHGFLNYRYDDQSIIARYNPLHWFLVDPLSSLLHPQPEVRADFPSGLNELDLSGTPLLTKTKAKNVLIILLEGIPGMYYPEIGKAMGVTSAENEMHRLAAATPNAMLVPDFTAHSHQTIRGLYSALCGDFSKLSWDTPKAFELQENQERAQACLPALMTRHGWSTHFLQAASLGFMGKDRLMPLIGFQQVHGDEWFTEPNPFPFEWGVVDSVFFQGATQYIANLQSQKRPWMLTLLTVGTHQPYGVPNDIADRFGSRKTATVDLLDQSVAGFIEKLRKDGVLKDTLVIITSDESHGSPIADWISSWGLALILAPEEKQLPRIKEGGYGLVDITVTVLDYLGVEAPEPLIGRSMFRRYDTAREMVSYTTSKRRWHTADNLRYECSDDGRCRVGTAASLLGPPPADFARDQGKGAQLFAITKALDLKVLSPQNKKTLKFANGEIRELPEQITNEWSNNLVGAQYLNFPAHSKVTVAISLKAIKAAVSGIHLKLLIKQWESTQNNIPLPTFPVLHTGEDCEIEFAFDNPEARQSFSFHLLGEGKEASLQVEKFNVTIENDREK